MDRGAWWATVHGMAKVGHNRSDLAHSHANLGAARWKRCMGVWEGGQSFQAVSPNLHVFTHLEAPQKQFQGHVTGFRAGRCLRLGGRGTKRRLVTEPGPSQAAQGPRQDLPLVATGEKHIRAVYALCFFFNLLFLAAPGGTWNLSFPTRD